MSLGRAVHEFARCVSGAQAVIPSVRPPEESSVGSSVGSGEAKGPSGLAGCSVRLTVGLRAGGFEGSSAGRGAVGHQRSLIGSGWALAVGSGAAAPVELVSGSVTGGGSCSAKRRSASCTYT